MTRRQVMRATIEAGSVQAASDVVAELGEGPCWDGATLLWVDIPAGRLHRTGHPSGQTATARLGAPVSAVLPTAGGGVLVARRDRLALVEAGGTERTVASVPAPPGVRFNDGAVDPQGRVWIGSMDTREQSPLGVLYRLDAGGVLTPVITGVTISNGLGWSPDGSRLYYIDSPTCRVDVLDFDAAFGEVSGRRPFADLSGEPGVPDGLTVDADGGVWVARYAGGALHRYTPDGGLDTVVSLPVTYPTSCAFGGPDLADLYVTTASAPLSAAGRAGQPLAGRLFRLRPGPKGLPQPAAVIS